MSDQAIGTPLYPASIQEIGGYVRRGKEKPGNFEGPGSGIPR
jgi:hypothetical protein